MESAEGFAAWVHKRVRLTHPAGTPCPAEKHGWTFVVLAGDTPVDLL